MLEWKTQRDTTEPAERPPPSKLKIDGDRRLKHHLGPTRLSKTHSKANFPPSSPDSDIYEKIRCDIKDGDAWRGRMLAELFSEAELGDVAVDASIPEFLLTPDGNEGRNVFLTAKEYSGIGLFGRNRPGDKPTIQVGDKIAVFPKMKNPLILRYSLDDKDAYKSHRALIHPVYCKKWDVESQRGLSTSAANSDYVKSSRRYSGFANRASRALVVVSRRGI